MTSATPQRARRRALTGAVAALGLGMIMTTHASSASAATWPTPNGSEAVSSTIPVSGTRAKTPATTPPSSAAADRRKVGCRPTVSATNPQTSAPSVIEPVKVTR